QARETVRLKPDTTREMVRLKPETTREMVRLKPDTTYEVDEAAVDVDRRELHRYSVSHVDAALAFHQLPLDRRRRNTDEGALRRRAGDDRVEPFADAVGDDERGGRFPHLALDLVGRVFLPGAVRGKP